MQCQLCPEGQAPSADYLFTHLETGDSVAMCAVCFPEWLKATVEAVATALVGDDPETPPEGEAVAEAPDGPWEGVEPDPGEVEVVEEPAPSDS